MPTVLTPPTETETRRRPGLDPGTDPSSDEDERNHGGTGALPPAQPPRNKRTGGNGDGDDDEFRNAPQGRRGPRDRLATARIGTAMALFGILLLFVGLVSAFLVTKSSYHVDAYDRVINPWLPVSIPTVLWLNTAVLFLSSVTAEMARRAMFHEKNIMDEWFGLGKPTSKRAGLWLAVTLIFGMLFLVGQYMAWLQLNLQHVSYGNSSGHFFYILTGAHALHLFVGVSLLFAALAILKSSRQFVTRQIWVDSTVWYWHAMGILWVALFVLLEFCQ